MKIHLFFHWYDLWVGVYVDTVKQTLYICPIPMFGIEVSWYSEPLSGESS